MKKMDRPTLIRAISSLLPTVSYRDKIIFKRRLNRLKTVKNGNAGLVRLFNDVSKSVEDLQDRLNSRPSIHYPNALPITDRRSEIVEAIRQHQVIILAGETGSGKTTQIPKMCIEAGRGINGLIGCTQPRRIAALTVAGRIAEELGDANLVGCAMRFHDSSRPENFIRIMTDGILLAEARTHSALWNYDTIIIDEAHERSLNIDVLLGILRRIIEKRRDLKVIITSATLDTEKFSKHFENAPIILVSGRMFPVELRYPFCDEDGDITLAERTALAVHSIMSESRYGDILVFLPTEQDIRDTMDLVSRDYGGQLNILPLFARLTVVEQKKVFVQGGRRKLIVATNIAETSLTIPGIRYVVDTGLARISRYNPGTGTHGLPVDPISKASADQRKGRCGRVENGVCLRLYTEEDYNSRPEYTPPEIQRTNLAEVILRLIAIGIADIENFPFVDSPSAAGIRDGIRTLVEIGAIQSAKERVLTDAGRLMAQLPLDPRLARILIQADRESCLADLLPIVAALSLQDPRERPPKSSGSADTAHASFRDAHSDFIEWLNIWDGFQKNGGQGSFSGRLKSYCRKYYLSFRRMKEWMDIHRQIKLIMEENGYNSRRYTEEPWIDAKGEFSNRYAAVHRSILAGLLSHIARRRDDGSYDATRRRSVFIHPGSRVRKTHPAWIVAAEIVRTSRLFARSVAEIDPHWLCDIGSHLITKTWIHPHWDTRHGQVMAEEQQKIFGFLVPKGKMVPYALVQPREAREIFIRRVFVEENEHISYSFLENNRSLLRRLQKMEAKLRRKDVLVGEEDIYIFYEKRLPEEVLDIGTLNHAVKENPTLETRLVMTEDDLLTGVNITRELQQFPDSVEVSGEDWKISYVFDSASKVDGITLEIPSGRLSELPLGLEDWAVPGILREKLETLMRILPKNLRRHLIPISDTADAAAREMPSEGSLPHVLSSWLYSERDIDISPDEWKLEKLPNHLRIRFSLQDNTGTEIASGFDLGLLKKAYNSSKGLSEPLMKYRAHYEQHGLTSWPKDIPQSVRIPGSVVLWSALHDDGETVSLRLFEEACIAEKHHRLGQVKLAQLFWARELSGFKRTLFFSGAIRVCANYVGGAASVEKKIWNRVMQDIFSETLHWKSAEWESSCDDGGSRIYSTAKQYFEWLGCVLEAYCGVRQRLMDMAGKSHRKDFIASRLNEAEAMVNIDCIMNSPTEVWKAMPRWLKAIEVRTRRGINDPKREQGFLNVWTPLYARFIKIRDGISPMAGKEKQRAIENASIVIEELRVALSAPGEIRPAGKVSESRFCKILDAIERMR